VETQPTDTLARLQAAGPPIPTDAWSLGDEPLRAVLAAVDAGARTVAECGSGRSTVFLARRLRELGEGSVHSLEHDAGWAERTRGWLATEGLQRAKVITAPLVAHPLAGPGPGWYDRDALAELPAGIDLLLIDGPPANDPGLQASRHPALAELGPKLAPRATIILDDASRSGETEAIALWSREFGLDFVLAAESRFATGEWPLYVDRH